MIIKQECEDLRETIGSVKSFQDGLEESRVSAIEQSELPGGAGS
jgi:hypothetical protein